MNDIQPQQATEREFRDFFSKTAVFLVWNGETQLTIPDMDTQISNMLIYRTGEKHGSDWKNLR